LNIKPKLNHTLYLHALEQLGPEGRLKKAFDLSSFSKDLFLSGLRSTHPQKSEREITALYLDRLLKCHNRNF